MNFVHKWPLPGSELATRALIPASPETSRARTGAGEWMVVAVVLGNVWWTTLCLGGYRPETMPVTISLTMAALAFCLMISAWRGCGLISPAVALATLPFLIYAAANACWVTPVPWLGWRDWLGWAQTAMVFWVVLHSARDTRTQAALVWGLVALAVVAVALALYQFAADPTWLMMGRRQAPQFVGRSSGPFGIPNSLAALMILLLPAMLGLTFQRGVRPAQRVGPGCVAVVLGVGVLLTISRGAWLALTLALAAWPLLSRGAVAARHGRRRWLWCTGIATALLLSTVVLYQSVPRIRQRADQLVQNRGETARAVLWPAAWRLFLERPVVGTGAGSFNVLFERHRPGHFWDEPQWAHNEYLNTLSDYGAIGFILSFGVAAGVVWQWRRQTKPGEKISSVAAERSERWQTMREGLGIGLLAFALQLFVDFNLKIPALAQAAAIVAAVAASPADGGGWVLFARPRWIARLVPFGIAALLLVTLAVKWLPLYRAETLRYETREMTSQWLSDHPSATASSRSPTQIARERLTRSVDMDPANGQAWADLADAWIQTAREEPSRSVACGRTAESAANRALALSQVVPEFWLRRALALELQERWRDAWADFTQALTLAPRRADLWYYYAYHLSLRDLEGASRALQTCLELDPWNQPALALQKRLGGGHR